jgi:formate-dependent nitrite reductase cytochrome c552 subunit
VIACAVRVAAQDAVTGQHLVDAVNAGALKGVAPITCWTCHRGQTHPPRLPDIAWQGIRDQHVGEFTSPNAALTMSVYAAALGVDCSFCHEPGSFTAPTKPAYAMVAKMVAIFDEIPGHFDASRMPSTQCYMCHQGKRIPERRPE